MYRNHIINNSQNLIYQKVNRSVAIHQAGHAAAIYFLNLQNGLPPVFFQILISPSDIDFQSSQFDRAPDNQTSVKIDGGRLIPVLLSSVEQATSGFYSAQTQTYERAFEADMINNLAGPLAEAKYIAQRDGELMTPNMINVNSLHYYGGSPHLESLNEYLECFLPNQELKALKISELFLAAFNFVNKKSNWRAITALADFIMTAEKDVIDYNEIVTVLETSHSETTPRLFAGYPGMWNEYA